MVVVVGDVQKCTVCVCLRSHTPAVSRIRLSFLCIAYPRSSFIPRREPRMIRYNNILVYSQAAHLCIYSFLNLILFFYAAHSLLSGAFSVRRLFFYVVQIICYLHAFYFYSSERKKIRTKLIVCTSSMSMICCCDFLFAMNALHTHTHTHCTATALSVA